MLIGECALIRTNTVIKIDLDDAIRLRLVLKVYISNMKMDMLDAIYALASGKHVPGLPPKSPFLPNKIGCAGGSNVNPQPVILSKITEIIIHF